MDLNGFGLDIFFEDEKNININDSNPEQNWKERKNERKNVEYVKSFKNMGNILKLKN